MDEELTQVAKEVVARLKELETSPGWKPNGDKPCLMYKMEIGDRLASKGVAKVNYNIEKIVAFL